MIEAPDGGIELGRPEDEFEHEIAVLRPEPGDILVVYYPPGEEHRVRCGCWESVVRAANRVPCLIVACPNDMRLEDIPAEKGREMYRRLRRVWGKDD